MNGRQEEKRLFESRVLCMQGRSVTTDTTTTYPSLTYPNGNTGCFHDFYEIELFHSGRGTLFLNGLPNSVERGFFYLLRPGDYHNYQLDEEHRLTLRNLKLAEERVRPELVKQLSRFEAPYVARLNEEELRAVQAEFDLLDQCLAAKDRSLLLQNVIDRILILLLRGISSVRQKGDPSRGDPITRIADYINENYAGRIRQADAAKLISQSEDYFGAYFKRRTGLCFSEYLKRVRLYHAQRLLRTTALSIKEIAYSTGFHSQEYFARVFRSAFGKTPLEYRKENGKEGNGTAD